MESRDTGFYKVLAENKVGKDQATFEVTVKSKWQWIIRFKLCRVYSINIYSWFCTGYTLKTKNIHDNNFDIAGGNVGCHNDKLCCLPLRRSWHHHYNSRFSAHDICESNNPEEFDLMSDPHPLGIVHITTTMQSTAKSCAYFMRPLKTESHYANFVFIGGTGVCHTGNSRCH